MSRETISEVRIWCDGCGLTYLEIQASVEIDAMQRCGWVTRERNGGRQDLCPTCRPDSPFEAVDRVRELHRPCSDPHLHDGGRCCLECSDYGRQGVVRMYPCDTLNALEGDSDE